MKYGQLKVTKVTAVATLIAVATLPLSIGCSKSTAAASSTPTITSGAGGLATATKNLAQYTPTTKDVNKTAFIDWSRLQRGFGWIFSLPTANAATDNSLVSIWTTAGVMSDLYNSGEGTYETIQDYMGQMFDPAWTSVGGSALGAAGRYVNAMFQACLTTTLITSTCGADTDGLPKVGTCTFTIDLAAIPATGTYEGCPVPAGGVGGSGSYSVTTTISAVSGNANYTKVINATNAPGGGGYVYMKLDSAAGIFNMENISPTDNQQSDANCGGSRWILAINGNVTQLEYEDVNTPNGINSSCSESGSNGNDSLYRIHIDTGNNVAYVVGMNATSAAGAGQGTAFAMSGQPLGIAAGTANVSVSFWSNGSGSTGQITDAPSTTTSFLDSSVDGCVSASTGSANSTGDGALSCDIAGVDVVSAKSMLTSTLTSHLSASEPIGQNTPAPIAWTSGSDIVTTATTP